MMDELLYAQDKAACTTTPMSLGNYEPPTIRQKLEQHKAILESKLTDINKALEILNAQPQMEEFTNILRKANL